VLWYIKCIYTNNVERVKLEILKFEWITDTS